MEEEKMTRELLAFWQRFQEGQTCEVCKLNNDLIFLGKLHLTRERAVIEITEASGAPVPPVIYNERFKLKLYLAGEGALLMEASVCGSSRHFWRFDHLRPLFAKDSRSYFRQRVDVRAVVRPQPVEGQEQPEWQEVEGSQAHPCHLEDLSLSGAQFSSAANFEENDWVRLCDVHLVQGPPFSFIGQIRWKREEAPGKIFYGCQFDAMGQREQDRLFRAIFAIQRQVVIERRESSAKR